MGDNTLDNDNKNNDGNGITKRQIERETTTAVATKFKIDFSFKREVFFIIAGAIAGAIIFVIPVTRNLFQFSKQKELITKSIVLKWLLLYLSDYLLGLRNALDLYHHNHHLKWLSCIIKL